MDQFEGSSFCPKLWQNFEHRQKEKTTSINNATKLHNKRTTLKKNPFLMFNSHELKNE
jgi:hypothetical protein